MRVQIRILIIEYALVCYLTLQCGLKVATHTHPFIIHHRLNAEARDATAIMPTLTQVQDYRDIDIKSTHYEIAVTLIWNLQ